MKIYLYNPKTGEYFRTMNAQENPKKKGEFLMPPNTTTLEIPEYNEDCQIPCFIDGKWEVKADLRYEWQIKLDDLTFSLIDYIGEVKEGYQFVSQDDYLSYKEDCDRFKVIDGVFTDISNTEEYKEIKRKKEAERVGNLTCTKRVFVLMLEQLGFDYFAQIEPLIESNRQAKLEWNLCVELERKNPLLDVVASQIGVTSDKLDDLFKYANGEIKEYEFLGV